MPLTYEPIATSSPNGTTTVTFSSIPSTYTDLRLVATIIQGSASNVFIRFNGDTATNYSWNSITAAPSPAGVRSITGNTSLTLTDSVNTNTTATTQDVNIFSYAGSTFKSILFSQSAFIPGSIGGVIRSVGLWRSTSAINSIEFYSGTNFNAGTMVTLYGIKAA
jgi:hypothetical protein